MTEYGDYPLFESPGHAILTGYLVGAAEDGDLKLRPMQDEEGNYLPDLRVEVRGVKGDVQLVMRVLPPETTVVPESGDDKDGMRMTVQSAAHAVLWVLETRQGTMQPGSYVEALVLAAVRAHPLELRGVFARAYPALAEAVSLYKYVEDGVAILRERAGLPAESRDAHEQQDD